MKDIYEGISNNLRTWRKKAGLTQTELANLCGVARNSICSIERGEYYPGIRLACVITVNLFQNMDTGHMSPDYLFADLWKLDDYFYKWFCQASDEYYEALDSYGGIH